MRYDDGIPERRPDQENAEERKRLAWIAWESDPQREADWKMADQMDRAVKCRRAGQCMPKHEPPPRIKCGNTATPIIRSDGVVFQSIADAARESGFSHSTVICAMRAGRMLRGGYRFYYLNAILAEGRAIAKRIEPRSREPIAKLRKAAA